MAAAPNSPETNNTQSQPPAARGTDTAPPRKPARVTYEIFAQQVHDQSVASQQELYNRLAARGPWHQNHTPLSDLMRISIEQRGLTLLQAKKLVIRSYYQGDSEAYRLAQELFSTPEDGVVPGDVRAQASREDPIIPGKILSPKLYSQLGLLYTRVPEALAVNFGLLPARKRTPRESLTDCATPQVTIGTKYFFECIQPVGNRAAGRPNRIVLTIAPPSQRVQDEYRAILAEYGIQPSRAHIGSILYTRHAFPAARPDKSPFPRQRAVQYFATAYDALRKTYHENSQYAVEEEKLAELKRDWKAFSTTDLAGWMSEKKLTQQLTQCASDHDRQEVEASASALNNSIVERYRELLELSIENFKGSIHKEKQAVYERLVAMKEKLDGSQTGRLNPNPITLQDCANQALKQLRVEDIRIKKSYNVNDHDLLRNTLDHEAAILSAIDSALRKNAHVLDAQLRIFTSRTLQAYEISREVSGIRARLNIPLTQLKEIRLRPFVRFKEPISQGARQLHDALHSGNRVAAKEALALMFHATRLARATRAVEELKIALINPASELATAFEKTRQQIDVLHSKPHLYANPIGIETSPDALKAQDSISSLRTKITDLQRKYLALMLQEVLESAGVPLTEQRTALYKEVLETLKNYNFEPAA